MAMPTPWIAPGNSFNGEPQTLYRTMFLKCFNAVLRTGRRVPALVAQPGRNNKLV